MKKFYVVLIALTGLLVTFTSCNKRKTYAELLSEERDAIEKFIRDSNLVILNEFPTNGIFQRKQFYKDPNSGVYFNIIDRGDVELDAQGKIVESSRAKLGEAVYVRYNGMILFKNDTVKYNNMNPVSYPFGESFKFYGLPTAMNISSLYGSDSGNSTTPAWVIPLQYVGHNGRVKMIVPFNFASNAIKSEFVPVYYDMVLYRLESKK